MDKNEVEVLSACPISGSWTSAMNEQPAITVVGSTMIDIVVNLDRIPKPGETLVGESSLMGFGGKGANQAAMASLLGARVAMVNKVGDDTFGALTLENLSQLNIDRRYVEQVSDCTTGVASIWIDAAGENRIALSPGANLKMDVELVSRAFDSLPAPDVVICQLEVPQEVVRQAFIRARQIGAITILNPAPAARIGSWLLKHTDWLIPNENEFEDLESVALKSGQKDDKQLPERVRHIAGMYDLNMAVTLGRRGVLLAERGSADRAEPIRAVEVNALDTTGAGDAFVGAFAYALGRGFKAVDAARLARACAASSVTRRGTQASFPRGPELQRMMEELPRSVSRQLV